jgi:arylsulfatase A-like enzyme
MRPNVSLKYVFRFVFVAFSLYLLADAFYRWDGFSYYAPFSEYLPSVALASVLWTLLAFITAIITWIVFLMTAWLLRHLRMRVGTEELLAYSIVFAVFALSVFEAKRLIWPNRETSTTLKYLVLFSVTIISAVPVWLLRKSVHRVIEFINERITPLVWLFGLFVIISLPIVAYHTWSEGDGQKQILTDRAAPSVSSDDRPDILLVTFDALSARHMSLYGYERETTPFIEKWSKNASVFSNVKSESDFTAPTTASLMTGKRVWTHMRYHRMRGSRTVRSENESLPVVLKKNGYVNMAFISNDIASVNNLGIERYFDVSPPSSDFWAYDYLPTLMNKFLIPLFGGKFRIHDWLGQEDFITGKLIRRVSGGLSHTSRPPKKAFNAFLNAAGNYPRAPFFAWIHVDPPHFPYLPEKPFMGMFDASNDMRTLRTQLEGKTRIREYVARTNKFPEEVELLKARYDEFIRYCDDQFENLIKKIEERKELRNMIIILSTDHGEIFTHNNLLHGDTLFEPELSIPLIIKMPGHEKGRIIDELVEQIDIPATILDLIGIPIPQWMEGRSLTPLMHNKELPQRPAFSMNLEKNPSRGKPISKGTVAIWDGDYKMIYDIDNGRSLLFNLRNDPDEIKNIVGEEPETAGRLRFLIRQNLYEANKRNSKYK